MNKFTKIFVGALAAVAIFASAASAAYTHTGLLKMGMTSSQVMSLQQALNANGFVVATTGAGSPGMESMYFGAKTKAAVMAFQSAKGLTPVDGVVGNITGTSLMANQGGGSGVYPAGCSSNSGFSTTTGLPCSSASLPTGCTSTAGFSPVTGMSCSGGSTPTSGPLAGTDGTIDTISTLSSYNDEEVGEGQNDVKVAGFEVETSNDGDVSISSVKLTFDPTDNGAGDSSHLDDYVESVSVWMGSTKVGSASVDDFTENSDDTSTKTITLSGATVKADDTVKFYISVDAANTFDSGDIDTDDFSVGISSLRYVDGSGVTTTIDGGDTEIGGGDAGEIGWDAVGDGIEMDFVSFGTAADTELKISKDSDSPQDGIVIVDDADSTDGVVLLTGKLRLEGDSDVTIDALPVTFTVSGDILSDIASSVILVLDGEEYSESSATTAGGLTSTITFDNLDFDLSAGDSVDYEIRADINGTDDFGEGETLLASITSDNRSAIDVENEEGDQVADSDKTGTAIGEAQEFRSEGISVTLVSVDESTNNDGNLGTYTIKFKVAAVGDDAYIGTAATKYTYALQEASLGATTGGVSAAITNTGGSGNSTSTTTGGNWKINEGTSTSLTLQVFRADLAGGAYRAVLSAIGWDSSDADAALDNSYTSNMDDFKTDYIQLL